MLDRDVLGLGNNILTGSSAPPLASFLIFFKIVFFMCAFVLPACMSAHSMCAWCSQRPEDGVRSPGADVTGWL